MTYHPPFFSERVGESHFNACTIASGCMTLASWSLGELIPKGLNQTERRQLREELEPGPVDQARGFNPLDVNDSARQRWSDLDLPDMPSWDNPRARLRIRFPEWKRRVQKGECGILQGNVARVQDRKSPLHRFVGSVGHAIYVDEGGDKSARIYDPMGLPADTYDGSFVPWEDLEQFASEFSGAGFVFCSLVKKGDQNSVSLNSKIAALTKELNATDKRLATAQANAKTTQAALDLANQQLAAATADLAEAQAAVAPLQAQVADLTVQLAAATDGSAIVNLQAQLDAANAALTSAQAMIASDDAEIAALNTEVADLKTQLAQCQDSIPQPGDTDGLVSFLRRFLRRTPK